MNKRHKAQQAAAILAASILAPMIITGCEKPQQSADPQWEQWEEEVNSAKTDDELFEIVLRYYFECKLSILQLIELEEASQFISVKKQQDVVGHNLNKSGFANARFLVLYPHSKHYANVEGMQGNLMKFVGFDAEQTKQEAIETIRASERIHRQRER